MKTRLTKDKYAALLAGVASLRSEDPKRKVGAVAMDRDGRVLAAGYNGLPQGVTVTEEWWTDAHRRSSVIHAEANLLSLVRRGEVYAVAVTTAPCSQCALNIIAHGVKRLIYCEPYSTDPLGLELLNVAGLELVYQPVDLDLTELL
jgi:dCMP deaminase